MSNIHSSMQLADRQAYAKPVFQEDESKCHVVLPSTSR